MNFSKQLKKYWELKNFSQEELAEKIYVTRQTISKWENDKSYPDIHNLIALSLLFDISLDELIKVDVEKMEQERNLKTITTYSWCMLIFIVIGAISIGPAIKYYGVNGVWIPLVFLGIAMYSALKLERIKKVHQMKTYLLILAFLENREIDLERSKRDQKKDFWSKVWLVVAFSIGAGLLSGISLLIFS